MLGFIRNNVWINKSDRLFSYPDNLLADQNPELMVNGSSWLDNLQLELMDATQISQLLIAIADTLDKSKRQGASSIEEKKSFSFERFVTFFCHFRSVRVDLTEKLWKI
ncbi:hypothetical protein IQ238_17080 [Pleurocapsales cyanobacterium LEGE 06147]|nr:hypothetical protein [Pleurocapsales cyanobacterium LEGE 06147]